MVKLPLSKNKKEEKINPEPSFSISRSTMPVKNEGEGFTAEDIRLIITEWLKELHVRFKTRYTKRQVRGVTKIEPVGLKYNVKCILNMLLVFRIAKLSEEGQSSKELVDILKERLTGLMEEKTTVNKGYGRFFE